MDKIERKGFTIRIINDVDPIDPREFDNLGTMVGFNSRYWIGDHFKRGDRRYPGKDGMWFYDKEDFENWVAENAHKIAILIPFQALDYGSNGIAIRRYDICEKPELMPQELYANNYLFVTKEQICKEYGTKIVTPAAREKARKLLLGELDEYSKYVEGDVWGYEITKNGEFVDSCWGFFGYKYCLEEAESIVDAIALKEEEAAWELVLAPV